MLTALRYFSLLCLLFAISAQAAETSLEADLQKILNQFLAENMMAPGACIYAECPSLGLKWSGVEGTIAVDSEQKLTDKYTVRIASNTKTYVACGVLRLTEQGRLNLDDSLSKYLPEQWRTLLVADCYDVDSITIRQMLSHTSGLHEHSCDERYANAIMADTQHIWTRDELIRLLVDWTDPVGPPGKQYRYSDTGYVILGEIIEQITNKSLGQAVADLVDYKTLGLKSTWWEYMQDEPQTAGPRAHQYYGTDDVTDWNASYDLYGGGGIIASVPEMARFTRLLLKGQVLENNSTLSDMLGNGTSSYRLGLMCMELGGHVVWGHQGFWNTFVFHVPALDLTVSGSILNHHAANGKDLAAEMIARVSREINKK